jgi:hypothetical protein
MDIFKHQQACNKLTCLLKHVIEENIEATGRRGRRRKQLLNDLKIKTGYWKLNALSVELALEDKLKIE